MSRGRKRHILTDTGGLLVGVVVNSAAVQDRDGAPALLATVRAAFPWLCHVFADGAYAGAKLETALERLGRWTLEIAKRSETAQGVEVLPRRWVVECTLVWLNRNRRLAQDFETGVATAETWDHARQRATHCPQDRKGLKSVKPFRVGLLRASSQISMRKIDG